MRSLSRAPVIWLFLVVQVPDASDMRRVPRLLRPFDCFVLGLEGLKDMVRVVFNDVILYGLPSGRPFGLASTKTRTILFSLYFCVAVAIVNCGFLLGVPATWRYSPDPPCLILGEQTGGRAPAASAAVRLS